MMEIWKMKKIDKEALQDIITNILEGKESLVVYDEATGASMDGRLLYFEDKKRIEIVINTEEEPY